jgi:hypothetical protein
VGSTAGIDAMKKKKNLLLLLGIEHRILGRPARRPVAIPNERSGPLIAYHKAHNFRNTVLGKREALFLLWRDYGKVKKKVKLSLCLTDYALRQEGVWGSGCLVPHFLDLDASWR